ncbi:hypothetical protein QBC46DRAFT_128752 [Diplogelasinospora grovesii]|uniref:Zn(2)-C6 fungal-type domain-containing protein n=1 Tax=Diplogelasinospora grovesii TaxID=303347 RepID=A0AAN6N8M3_9PEZI|nr:hypothetical protein QBC46DRAFT_128752 [Diplogelasinospora grovesii]
MLSTWAPMYAVLTNTFQYKDLQVASNPLRKRRGPYGRFACVRCRSNKVRCTGEDGGCQRCISKGHECDYGAPPDSPIAPDTANPTKATTHRKRKSDALLTPNSDAIPQTPDNIAIGDGKFEVPGSMKTHLRSPSSDPCLLSPESLYSMPVDSMEDFFTTDFQPFSGFGYSSPIERPADDSFIASLDPSLVSVTDCEEDIPSPSTSHGEPEADFPCDDKEVAATVSHPTPSCQMEATCSCINTALVAHENLSLHIGPGRWSSNPRTSLHKTQTPKDTTQESALLQCLKRTVATLEELLNCHISCGRSEFVMLLISTCSSMLSAAEYLVCGASQEDKIHPSVEQKSSGPFSRAVLQTANPGVMGDATSPGEDDLSAMDHCSAIPKQCPDTQSELFITRGPLWQPTTTASDSPDSSFANTEPSQPRFEIGSWGLDEDDEHHVFRGLLTARMTKLGFLLKKLQQAVERHDWPGHGHLVQQLQARYERALCALKEGLFAGG